MVFYNHLYIVGFMVHLIQLSLLSQTIQFIYRIWWEHNAGYVPYVSRLVYYKTMLETQLLMSTVYPCYIHQFMLSDSDLVFSQWQLL